MKKLMSMVLTFLLITGTSTAAFAAGTDTTGTDVTQTSLQSKALNPAQIQARKAYIKLHIVDIKQLAALRLQTAAAQKSSNADAKLIKDTVNAKVVSNKESIIKLKEQPSQKKVLGEQVKSIKQANKDLKEKIKNQVKLGKTIHETIKSQEKEKAQLWSTYKENIKNKDYTTAGLTFKAIIEKKTAILGNINKRKIILDQVLTSLK